MLVFCCFEALNIKILAKMCVICWKLIFYLSITDPRLIIKQMKRSIIDVFMIKMSCLSICIIIEVQKTIFLSKFPQKAEMQGADLTTISINYTFIFVLKKPKAGVQGAAAP
jgi:hypothetical protein